MQLEFELVQILIAVFHWVQKIKGVGMLDLSFDWNDLKVLLALWRANSFASAAKSLRVDPSTVSRRLSSLEKAVGFQILIRGNREFSWTEIGNKLVDTACKAESAIYVLQQQVRAEREIPAGNVRVAMPPGMISAISPWLSATTFESEDVQIGFIGCTVPLDDIYASADVVICYNEPTGPDLISQVLFTEEFGLYAAKAYIRSAGMPPDSDAIKALSLVSCDLSHIRALRDWFDFSRQTGTSNRVTVVDNLQSAEQLIGMGYGVGVLPSSQVRANPNLQRLDHLAFKRQPVYLSYHVSVKRSARIKAAVHRLRRAFKSLSAGYPSSKCKLSSGEASHCAAQLA
jgi:DNA-binding transcriptional LysR family regulator